MTDLHDPPTFDLSDARHVHIVGIGGAGMSAIATLLLALGHRVSGSDFKASRFTERLAKLGATVAIGHDPANVDGTDAVAISSAVRPANPEVQAAVAAGIPVLRRVEILSLLTRRWTTIAVAGTHGKTTTSSMLAVALLAAGGDPSYLVGGELNEPGANAYMGTGDLLVCEADESDGTFLDLGAAHAVITNVEADHLDHYGDLATLEASFARFMAEVPGVRVVCGDDAGAMRVAAAAGVEPVTYGFGEDVRYRATGVEPARLGVTYRLLVDGADRGPVTLAVPGRHNVANSLAALAMAAELGFDVDALRVGLGGFGGVGRRFELRGRDGGVTFVDDYAHLPAEVGAALEAARAGKWGRVVAVFQPHLFSRTRAFSKEFGAALAAADVAYVTDVYAAREDPVPGVTGALVADAVTAAGGHAAYVAHRADIAAVVSAALRPGDLCISLGAGDITSLADEILGLRSVGTLGAAAAELEERLGDRARAEVPLGPLTTWKVGGPAAVLVEPHDEQELLAVAEVVRRHRVPVLVVGRGSNLLVDDEGFPGVVVRLGQGFNWIETEGTVARAGAATPLPFLARSVGRAGLTGLEFGVGIPASVGGAVRMNAGGHGSEVVEVLEAAGVVDLAGDRGVEVRTAAELALSYRHSNLKPSEVVVWASFALAAGDRARSEAEMNEIVRWRKENQPAGPSAGSVFTNPPGDAAGRLIEAAGCKGLRIGGAFVSPRHANFVMADPGASAADVRAVIEAVRLKVREVHGVDLRTEVRTEGGGR